MKGVFFLPNYRSFLVGAFVLAGLYLASLYSYLLFHSLAEMFSIVIAFSIFALAWNSRRITANAFFVFLGIAYLFIGALDLLHTLAYKGMGVFPGYDANLPTQLWIAARYVDALSLLAAPFLLGRRLNDRSVFLVYGIALAAILGTIFARVFPDCFLEGTGLTSFKKASEYLICGFFLGAAVHLTLRREALDPRVARLLVSSFVLMIVAEMAFTFYISVYGLSNLLGHFIKLTAFYLTYKAIIETGLVQPYTLLFRDLKQNEEALRRAHDELELRVRERTAELVRANTALQAEIGERLKTEAALRESEGKYSRLVESSLTGIYINQDGKIVFANQLFAAMHGYSPDKLIGMAMDEVIHPEDRAYAAELRAKRLRGEPAPVEYEMRGLTRDGHPIWLNRRITVIEYQGRPAVLGNVIDITGRKEIERALQESERELRFLSSQLLEANERERKTIAHELHDSIGQFLAAAKFGLERRIAAEGGGPGPSIALKAILANIQNAIDETRRIMTNLRPSILDDLGILATLTWFCREFRKVYSHLNVEKDIRVAEDQIPEPLKIVIFRVLQESLNNFAKYAQGDRVRVALEMTGGSLELSVQDDGVGFDPKGCRRGMGLSSMRERTELSGGSFALETGRGKGTTVRARWPLAPWPQKILENKNDVA